MPNIPSAEKRARQNVRRREANRFYRARARNAIKNARLSIEENDADARLAVRRAIVALDKAARKGSIHANQASRTQSRLMKRLNASAA